MKTFLIWTAAIIVAAVFVFLSFRWGASSIKADKDHLDLVLKNAQDSNNVLLADKGNLLKKVSSLDFEVAAVSRDRDSLISEIMAASVVIQDQKGDISKNLASGDQARAKADTSAIISNCDSLRGEIRKIGPVLAAKDRLEDSLSNLTKNLLETRDQVDTVHGRLLANCELRYELAHATTDSVKVGYNKLYKDDQKKTLALKIAGPALVVAIITALISSLKK